jgi:hypothetical protein
MDPRLVNLPQRLKSSPGEPDPDPPERSAHALVEPTAAVPNITLSTSKVRRKDDSASDIQVGQRRKPGDRMPDFKPRGTKNTESLKG